MLSHCEPTKYQKIEHFKEELEKKKRERERSDDRICWLIKQIKVLENDETYP